MKTLKKYIIGFILGLSLIGITGFAGYGTYLSELFMDGNINMQDHIITNIKLPVDNKDVASKEYVDASAGGGLTVYKNNGTTKIGTYLGISAYIPGDWTDLSYTQRYKSCDEELFYSDSDGITHKVLKHKDCVTAQRIIYFTNDNCTGNKYIYFGGDRHPYIRNNFYPYGRDEIYKVGYDRYNDVEAKSHYEQDGTCKTSNITLGCHYSNVYCNPVSLTSALCGNGPCKVK